MRLVLQGKPNKDITLQDLWVLFTSTDTFNVGSYLTKGYTMFDYYMVGPGGRGGDGGLGYYYPFSGAPQDFGGGGGGGGGSGQSTFNFGNKLYTLPGHMPVQISPDNTEPPKFDGTLFFGDAVWGGGNGGRGGDATDTQHGGGGGGGAGAGSNIVDNGSPWDINNPGTPAPGGATGYDSLNSGYRGSGGRGGTANPQVRPVKGVNGALISNSFGNPVYGGAGGGGGAAGGGIYSQDVIGAAGGSNLNAPSADTGQYYTPGVGAEALAYAGKRGGGGGAGGSGPNLTAVTRFLGLLGTPTIQSIFDGMPGAGGAGGYGGRNIDNDTTQGRAPGTPGMSGSPGCLLIRLYRP